MQTLSERFSCLTFLLCPQPPSRFDRASNLSAGPDSKEPPRRGEVGAKSSGAGAKGLTGVVKDKHFDEAHSLGDEDDLSSEASVSTNDSEPKPQRSAPHATGASQPAAAQGEFILVIFEMGYANQNLRVHCIIPSA